jgi:predicted metalloprotease with PDZ domain
MHFRLPSLRRLIFLVAFLPTCGFATVAYTLKPDLTTDRLDVTVRIEHPNPTETFEIPGWSPGYYVMEKYETQVSHTQANDDQGKSLTISRSGLRTWVVTANPNHPLILSYDVAGADAGLGFFGASVKDNEAYTNGAASFMYVLGRRNEDTSLHVDLPPNWKIATAMKNDGNDDFTAPFYDEMIDDPVQMGEFTERDFTVRGIPFRAVYVAPPGETIALDVDKETAQLKKTSEPTVDLFGGAPFNQYIYFFHLTPLGFQGGLEHHSGTVIAIPNAPGNDLSDLAAHEFFHAWNVKQIRPILLGPFDYTAPQRTGNLWFAEGVTDYYAKILTYRSAVHGLPWLLAELNDQINTYQAGKDRLQHTVEDASRAVWENGGFSLGDLDYYNKGLLSGLIFDAKIREVTHGKRSLDDVMRYLFKKYRYPNPGYSEDGIRDAINEVAGTNLSPLYDRLIRSTEELPYTDLEAIGMQVEKPNSSFLMALGFPTPAENTALDQLSKYGLSDADRFLNFAVPTHAGEADAIFARDGVSHSYQLPLAKTSSTLWELVVNPTPDREQMELFKDWTHR